MPTVVMSEKLVWMTEADLIFGEDEATGFDFAANCSSIRLERAGTPPKFTGLKPQAVWTGDGEWNVTATLADDYDDVESFWSYLWDNDGTPKPVTFRPHSGGTAFKGTVAISAGGAGGDQAAVSQSTVTLVMPSKPELVRPTP